MSTEKEKKMTVGAQSIKAWEEEADNLTQTTVEELAISMLRNYEPNLHKCIERGKKEFDGDFFVVILTKKEPLMPNVLCNKFLARESCPTPTFDQTVFHYHRNTGESEYLWTVPSHWDCIEMRSNILTTNKEEHTLLKFVLDFYDDTLLRKASKLNSEIFV